MDQPSFSPPPNKQRLYVYSWQVRLMLSLLRVFLHPDNHLHKVDVLSCQGGERMGRPCFSPPPKKQRLFAFSLQGKVDTFTSQGWCFHLSGWENNGPAKFFSTQKTICTRLMLYLVVVGKKWADPVFPHLLKSQDCMHIHDRVWLMFSLVGEGERMGRPSFSPPR